MNWLIDGRLGLELESQVWKFISVELVPVFVTNEQSPAIKQSFDGIVSQKSNGVGAMSGASLGLGFWVGGKPLQGTVLRAIFTNYAYSYEASDELGKFDEVSHTERHFYGYLGSQNVWGIFTLAGGFGLGVELNKERRCFPSQILSSATTDSQACPKDEQQIALTRTAGNYGGVTRIPVGNLHTWSYPVETMFRLSLGVTF